MPSTSLPTTINTNNNAEEERLLKLREIVLLRLRKDFKELQEIKEALEAINVAIGPFDTSLPALAARSDLDHAVLDEETIGFIEFMGTSKCADGSMPT
jgi:hypothetical protein